MQNYSIITDSACDISPEVLSQWGILPAQLSFHFEGEEKIYNNYDLSAKEFYDRLREGAIAKTSGVNEGIFLDLFEQELKKGNDILYIGFSSGLSTTVNSGFLAQKELQESYKDRKVIVVDSLSASAGFGLLLYLASQKKAEGANIEETAQYVEDMKLRICHWFTVDDLMYLKRGGRISTTAAVVGSVLGIKPILHMDNEGHLINVSTVRGRKNALKTLCDKFGESAENPYNSPFFICQGDCMEDVAFVESTMKETYGIDTQLVADVGPVIGAHTGPGVLSVFFVGKER